MKYRCTNTARDWLDLWLDKYSAELSKQRFAESEARAFRAAIRSYLTCNPGNPRAIKTGRLRAFVTSQRTDVTAPLTLFYRAIAPSETHLKLLASLAARAARLKSAGKKKAAKKR